MSRRGQDTELEQYRGLMTPPQEFADGFSWKTVIGAIFLGMVMMPASMYLALFAGGDSTISSASQWVTIIIFAEIARRSLKDLRMQEVYILFYMAGLAVSSPFSGLLWNQYFVQSDFANAMGIAQEIPSWYAPSGEVIREAGRTFFTRAWLGPILLVAAGLIIHTIDNYGLGYVLYRLTNDVEELPFPMAPVGASGIVALTETKENREKWRWRCFSIGGMMGIVFGIIYIGVPAITGLLLVKPVQLIPIPWIDFTPQLSQVLPATPINLMVDLGAFLAGMVIPFWAVVGGLLGVVMTLVLNPVLHSHGLLPGWRPQMGFIDAQFSNNVDFYLSFGIGLTIAVTLVSLARIASPLLRSFRRTGPADLAGGGMRLPQLWQKLVTNNVKRGDFSIFIALAVYVFNSAFWIALSCWLVPGFPWVFFALYAAIYTPLISYATAKMEGLCGQAVTVPMIREATYILSGYQGVKIWFAPAPLPNYGIATVHFRVLELTGTKIISQIKTQLVVIPVIIVSSLVFSNMLWQMAPVPSDAYPYAQKMWDLTAKNACLTYSSTMGGNSLFMNAWNWKYFGWGLGSGTALYATLSTFGLPTLLFFGLVRGMGAAPGSLVFQFLGALFGRFYMRRRFGDAWLKYAPVLLAGYACGMGLVAMVSVSITILAKMISPGVF
ncbi:MAG: peptide transporter [Verrucomicrobia bacterium]|nr:peptide transporter [Verrucomicrobiota bacterium]